MMKLKIFLLVCLFLGVYSCSDSDNENTYLPQSKVSYVQSVPASDLIYMNAYVQQLVSVFNAQLDLNGDLSALNFNERVEFVTKKGFGADSMYVDVYKISYEEQNPTTSLNKYINNSGILLLPSKKFLSDDKSCKLIVIAPGAYADNNESPSMVYKNRESLVNQPIPANQFSSFFNTLLATEGFAVLIPDYPGFGDSYKECTHPLLEAKPMSNSLMNLIKVTQDKISNLNYTQKEGVILSGYSLGGYVSGLTGKRIEESNSSIKLDLLFIGGAITDISFLAKEVQRDHATAEHLVFPWGIMSYKQNGYPNLNIDDIIIKEQQTKITDYIMSGSVSATDLISLNIFPKKSSDFYTTKFRSNAGETTLGSDFAYLTQILSDNSFNAWKNKVEFKMVHAENDITCYYTPAKAFSDKVNEIGGKVTFETVKGDHLSGAISFYDKLLKSCIVYK